MSYGLSTRAFITCKATCAIPWVLAAIAPNVNKGENFLRLCEPLATASPGVVLVFGDG